MFNLGHGGAVSSWGRGRWFLWGRSGWCQKADKSWVFWES